MRAILKGNIAWGRFTCFNYGPHVSMSKPTQNRNRFLLNSALFYIKDVILHLPDTEIILPITWTRLIYHRLFWSLFSQNVAYLGLFCCYSSNETVAVSLIMATCSIHGLFNVTVVSCHETTIKWQAKIKSFYPLTQLGHKKRSCANPHCSIFLKSY